MTIRRRLDTPESRIFWESVDDASREVATWPRWRVWAGLYAVLGYPPSDERVADAMRGPARDDVGRLGA